MRIQEATIDPVIGSGSEDLTTSSWGEATLSITLKLSYLLEDCNFSPAQMREGRAATGPPQAMLVGRNPTPQGLRRGRLYSHPRTHN